MTEPNISTSDQRSAQFGITPIYQECPNITNWQTIETISEEFKASAIADDIAAINFRTWNPLNENDLDEVFTLLVAEPEHRNNGTLAGRSQNDLANTLRSGGWIFEGHLGVSVKPDLPRKNAEGKVIKYESPRGTGNQRRTSVGFPDHESATRQRRTSVGFPDHESATRQQLFVPHVSIRIADQIMAKVGAVREHPELLPPTAIDREFWGWFLSTELPLIITEGAKKAAALVSAGYAAIALNGVWGWGTNEKDMFGD
jgi:putative DNA primase/helicase